MEHEVTKLPASFIVLSHELIHSYNIMNGTQNTNQVGIHYYRDADGIVKKESSWIDGWYDDEFETVGIGYYSIIKRPGNCSVNPKWIQSTYYPITENALRAEHGMNRRVAYKTK